MTDKIRPYDLEIPLYSGAYLEEFLYQSKGDCAEAMRMMADLYGKYASNFRRVAGFIKENPGVIAEGQHNFITLEGLESVMDPLVRDGLIDPLPTLEEDEEEERKEELEAFKLSLIGTPDEEIEEEDNAVCTDYDSELCSGVGVGVTSIGITGGWDPDVY